MYNVVQLPGQTPVSSGRRYERFQITSDPNAPQFDVSTLKLPADVSAGRLKERNQLLSVIDRQPASPPQSRSAARSRSITARRSPSCVPRLSAAAWISPRSRPPLRDRYGRNTLGQSMLLARRLVESGVRFVNVNDRIHNGQEANWDSHQSVFPRHRDHLLAADRPGIHRLDRRSRCARPVGNDPGNRNGRIRPQPADQQRTPAATIGRTSIRSCWRGAESKGAACWAPATRSGPIPRPIPFRRATWRRRFFRPSASIRTAKSATSRAAPGVWREGRSLL